MKRPAELNDWDRDPVVQMAIRELARLPESRVSKRIPSPYTNPAPRPITRGESDSALVAFCCLTLMGGMLAIVGAVQLVRWIVEAVR